MPPKRKAEEIEAELQQQTEVAKRLKESVDTVASEFMCAISHELPVDPVTAEDGQVYERSAIEAWIARPGVLKSPKLNTPMGPRLFPSTQARNIIEQMVRSGAISGPKADAWAKKLADEKDEKELRAMAEGGDAAAMYHLGMLYCTGAMGLSKDLKQAAGWWQRGHDLGHATCSAMLGLCYARGEGVEKHG
ncbi:MAG: U-box domain-containing protein, partial [Novosphingobium sp.]